MKRLGFLLMVVLLPLFAAVAEGKDYVVKRIIDGDTIQLESGEVLRYAGIDAPELYTKQGGSEFFAKEAARYNKKLVLLKKVRLEYDSEKKDGRGRILAYVFVKNVFVNAELVKLGYAKATVDSPQASSRYRETLLSAQQRAAAEERGLWQEHKKDSEKQYMGNKRNYTLHRPSCTLVEKIPEKARIVFGSRADALKIGYSPCRKCKP